LLLEHADLIAGQLERAHAELTAFNQGSRGAATIGAFSSAILGLLPGALRALAERQPGVHIGVVEAESPDVFTALDAGEVDVAIAVDFAAAPPHTDRRYSRIDLLRDVLDLALPASHRFAHLDQVPLRDLATDPWIVAEPDTCCGAVTRSVCAAAGFTPDIRHTVNDWSAIAALVEAGAGIALIPRLAQPLPQRGLILCTPSTTGPAPFRSVFAAVRAGSEKDPVLATVMEQLRIAGRTSEDKWLT
jgi:DNA-binding transcriptional LysR family regulator